jgi:hypothetical protein
VLEGRFKSWGNRALKLPNILTEAKMVADSAKVTDCASNPHVVAKQRIESMHEINYDRDWVAVLVPETRAQGSRAFGISQIAETVDTQNPVTFYIPLA